MNGPDTSAKPGKTDTSAKSDTSAKTDTSDKSPDDPVRSRPRAHLTGERGEHAAAKLVQQRGWRVVGRNVRMRAGEADILASRAHAGESHGLVVEVKATRQPDSDPAVRVDAKKRARLFKMAEEWLSENHFDEVHVAMIAVCISADHEQLTWWDIEPF